MTTKKTDTFKPLRQDDAARRKYALNIDWLQLFCVKTQFFVPDGVNCWGYTTKKLDHGSKYWSEIFDVWDNEGIYIGQLAATPHRKDIDQANCVFKADNSLLYEEAAIDRVMAAIDALGLKYQGITRIDIAYDCNELYNGLQVPNLVQRYLSTEYLKCGNNSVMLWLDLAYHGIETDEGLQLYSANPRLTKKQKEKIAAEEEQRRIECINAGLAPAPSSKPKLLGSVPQSSFGSVTWGTRSQSVQVQIYDKSKELREVKMKHHIVQSWKDAGLDLDKPVYRIEFRITNRGKMLKNLETGKYYNLSVNEILCQQQLEQLFYDYSEKYLKFFINDGHEKLQNCPRLRILSLCNQQVSRQQHASFSKDYTRGTCIALNEINRHIVENRRQGSEIVTALEQVREYFVDAHDLQAAETRWMLKDLAMAGLSEGQYETISPEAYFEERLKGAPAPLAAAAAEARKRLEEFIANKREEALENIERWRQEAAADIERRLSNGQSVECMARLLMRDYDQLAREQGVDVAKYVYPEVAAMRPALERKDLEAQRAMMKTQGQSLLRELSNIPLPESPYADIEQMREDLREEARRRKDSQLLLQVVDDCPF